jgi:2-isopropylmalate synthase
VINEGATTVNIADTVGYSMPDEFGELIKDIACGVPNIGGAVLSAHCHNDLGLAVANTLAAILNGARQIEATVNGLGERAGNCSMEEVLMSLSTRASHFPLNHSADTTKIYRISQRVARLTGIPVPVNKAIVGQNAFSHQSGIHQHGILSNPMTYEIMTPQSVGKTGSTLVLGKLSGRHAFNDRLRSIGFDLSKEEADSAFERFIKLADRKKTVTDDDLEAIANSLGDVPELYKLTNFQIQCGNQVRSLASVSLLHGGDELTEAATGDGPIDAAYKAAEKIVGGKWPLATYDIKAVTEGMDALGEVIVRVQGNGKPHVGRGLSTDIIEASIFAYINAINRALSKP